MMQNGWETADIFQEDLLLNCPINIKTLIGIIQLGLWSKGSRLAIIKFD